MRDWKAEEAEHAAKREKVANKVAEQTAGIKTQNGRAKENTGAQQILNEMRQNKASVDLNRAMFEYDEENRKSGE